MLWAGRHECLFTPRNESEAPQAQGISRHCVYVRNSLRTCTGACQNIHVHGHVDTGVLTPHKNTTLHVEGDEVGAGAAVGLPVGLGVAVRQLAGPVRVGRHLHLLPALVLLHFHTGACGPAGSLVS